MGILRTLFPKLYLEEEFLCGVCKDVLEDPWILHPCEHAVCKSCIDPLATTTLAQTSRPQVPLCPVIGCCQEIYSREQAPRVFTSLLNKLYLNCPFDAKQCVWQYQLGELAAHRQVCHYNPDNLKACGGGCCAKLTRDDQGYHSCVAYLKRGLKETKEKLKTTEEKLRSTEEKLKTTEEKLKTMEGKQKESRNRVRELDPDASSDDNGSSCILCGRSVATGGNTQSGTKYRLPKVKENGATKYRQYPWSSNRNSVSTAVLSPNSGPVKKAEKRAAADGIILIKKSNRPEVAK